MKEKKYTILLAAMLAAPFALVSCEKQTEAEERQEEAIEAIEDAGEEVGDAIEDATD
ncbi:hypothetical protein [Roseibacillus ishigakijimensis]|uniref:Uncharacterized protein n=1 Tax=Roseibacillus ishigakijimensis TaxID=454146 RepID=A0A934VJY5_9BACT|nr:hypothetical protein [Roseibacillus ishigakijimensis]MBK1833089.1 hypothetical protein [Roseibacillus ishigakijimensis]